MNKNVGLLALCLLVGFGTMAVADDFLGAPVIPGGKSVLARPDRLENKYEISYTDAIDFYKNALKDVENVKFWDRGEQMYIEDHSNRPWHSITLSKDGSGTNLTIVQDNWTWIIGTLVLRFIAVFVVLLVLYVAMTISGVALSRLGKAAKEKK